MTMPTARNIVGHKILKALPSSGRSSEARSTFPKEARLKCLAQTRAARSTEYRKRDIRPLPQKGHSCNYTPWICVRIYSPALSWVTAAWRLISLRLFPFLYDIPLSARLGVLGLGTAIPYYCSYSESATARSCRRYSGVLEIVDRYRGRKARAGLGRAM